MGLARWRGFFDGFNSVQRNAMLKWMRKRRWWILLAAWLLFVASLFSPAINAPNIMFLSIGPIRVGTLPLYALLELHPHFPMGLEPFVLLGMVFFMASPLLMLARGIGRFPSGLAMILDFGLLLPWGVPICRAFLAGSPAVRDVYLVRFDLLLGYYLFAAAQTLAFVACAVGPPKLPKANRQRGFAVLPSVPPPPVTR
jgi:hypothetical protein